MVYVLRYVPVDASGLERLDLCRSYRVMANHQSVFETAAIVTALAISFRFVAGGHVSIDRGDRESSLRSLERAAARVRAGRPVVILPEGTRSWRGELGEFTSGGFHLTFAEPVPILPVSVPGSSRITPPRSPRSERDRIHVRHGACRFRQPAARSTIEGE